MKRIIALLTIMLFIILACKTDEINNNTCNVENPIEDFTWLKEIISDIEQSTQVDEFYISQAIHESKTVFIVGNCCAYCNTAFPVYNCEGDPLNILGCADEYINFSILNEDKVIWSSENFVCNDSNNFTCE